MATRLGPALGGAMYYIFVGLLFIGICFLAAGAFFAIGGLFGIVFGGTTSVSFFGVTSSLGVLGTSAVVLGICLMAIGGFFLFLAWIVWIFMSTILPALRARFASSSGTAGLTAGAGASGRGLFGFPVPPLPPFPLPPLPGGLGLLELVFMTAEQRAVLPPNVLEFADCIRGCLCSLVCNGSGHGSGGGNAGSGPGKVVDAGKNLLEDLEAQLELAKKKLQDAFSAADAEAVRYWTEKIQALNGQIAALT
jgi:hypothetical protein